MASDVLIAAKDREIGRMNAIYRRLLDNAHATIFDARAVFLALHEIGHAMGLKHCYNARCPMYYSNSVFDTDNKFSNFCEACEKRSRASKP